MAYYTLQDKCGLVDAEDSNTQIKKKSKKGTVCALIIDVRKEPEKLEYPLNDEAAFIVRFMVQGLDTALVSQLFASEYNVGASAADAEVQKVIAALQKYNLLKPLKPKTQTNHGAMVGSPIPSDGIDLNFSINGFGDWWFIGPF